MMRQRARKPLATAFISSFILFCSCATKGMGEFSDPEAYPVSRVERDRLLAPRGEDLNGTLPARVYIKTRTQTFNSTYEFTLVAGRIYCKKPTDTAREWRLFTGQGLPHAVGMEAPRSIVEISADADEIVALGDNGLYYYLLLEPALGVTPMLWSDKHGWPQKGHLAQNDLVRGNRAWALAKRKDQVLWYEDIFGNQHHYGVIGLETYYFLSADGQGIRFADNGLPNDFSHELLGPERGAFVAEALSASASTIFLINRAGEMYTRLADFDTIGSDPMLFRYTYKPEKADIPGSDPRSAFVPWGLPSEDWRRQEAISLSGQARLTKCITIAQTGLGNFARELRVAGLDAEGRVGYYRKQLLDPGWDFQAAPLNLGEDDFLPLPTSVPAARGAVQEVALFGRLITDNAVDQDLSFSIPDFAMQEGSCHLLISRGAETARLVVYPVEAWTYFTRYDPGRDGTPKGFLMTVEIPPAALDAISPEFRAWIESNFGPYNLEAFSGQAEATVDYLYWNLPERGGRGSQLFFTRSKDRLIEANTLRELSLLRNSLLSRCDRDELVLPGRLVSANDRRISVVDRDEVELRIQKNETLRAAILRELKTFRAYNRSAGASRWTSSALASITSSKLIRKIDPIGLDDLALQGDRLIKMSREVSTVVSAARSEYYDMALELIDLRLSAYRGIIRDFDANKLEASLPEFYAEDFAEYYRLVALPAAFTGTLLGQSPAKVYLASPQYPVFVIESEGENQTILLLELVDSARSISQRKTADLSATPLRLSARIRVLSAPGKDGEACKALNGQEVRLDWNGRDLRVLGAWGREIFQKDKE
jgi:hypothetical protein